jgi:hypothetical protein
MKLRTIEVLLIIGCSLILLASFIWLAFVTGGNLR